MAANRIKGITIEIGGETVGLQNALKDVNKKSRDLQQELKDVDKLLKFDPGNAEAAAQKQKLLAEQVQNTSDKLNMLKEAQAEVNKQFKSGAINEKQFRSFRREVEFTESDLKKLQQALKDVDNGNGPTNAKKDLSKLGDAADDAKGAVKDLGGELAGLAGGLAAGGGIAGAFEKSLDLSSLNTKIELSMEISEESKETVRETINTVKSYGIDAESALEGVRRQWALNKNSTDEANQAIADGAATIASSYAGIDFTELIQETNEISSELNMSNENALGLVNSLLKMGFPPEQLDIIAEYGKQLHDAGYNASEIQAIFAAGVETGTWNIDNLLDGIKEGRIKMAEFGQEIPKALSELLKGTDISAKQMQEWGKSVSKGGSEGSQAMRDVATALLGIKDETQRNALGVQVFGTIWEDQGTNIIDTLLNAKDKTIDLKEGQEELNKATEKLNADPAVQFQKAMSDLKTALTPLLTVISSVVSKVAEWVSENPDLAAAITAVATAIGIMLGILMAVAPIFTALSVAATALQIGLLPMIGIVAGVVAGIAALIAIGFLLYKNWDVIKAKAIEVWGNLKEWFSETAQSIKESFSKSWEDVKTKATEIWSGIKDWLSSTLESIKKNFTDAWNGVKDFMSETWTSIKNTLTGVWESIKSSASNIWESIVNAIMSVINPIVSQITITFGTMKSGIENVFNGIKMYFTGVWKVIKSIFAGALLLLVDLVTGDFEGMKTDAEAIWNNLKEGLSGIWKGIKMIFTGALEAIFALVTKIWRDLKYNTITVFNNMKDTLVKIWTSIKTTATTLPEQIKNTVTQKFEALKNAISEKMTAAKNKMAEIWGSIKTTAANLPEQIKNTVSQKFEALKSAVTEKMTAAKSKIEEIWNKAKNFLASIDLKQIGRDIIQGLVDGIGSMGSALMKKAKGIADNIKGTLRAAFDINSPSRYMRDMIGKNIGEGLIVGLDSMRHSISKASERMTAAAMPDIPKSQKNSTNGSVTGSKSFVQNLIINSPHALSPNEIARKNLQASRQLAMEWGI